MKKMLALFILFFVCFVFATNAPAPVVKFEKEPPKAPKNSERLAELADSLNDSTDFNLTNSQVLETVLDRITEIILTKGFFASEVTVESLAGEKNHEEKFQFSDTDYIFSIAFFYSALYPHSSGFKLVLKKPGNSHYFGVTSDSDIVIAELVVFEDGNPLHLKIKKIFDIVVDYFDKKRVNYQKNRLKKAYREAFVFPKD